MQQTLIDIKKELRANMNGIASQVMRQAGMDYHIIWGIEIPRLRIIATEFTPDRRLGQTLWNENVRESRLLGIMLTPPDQFLPEVADIWASQLRTSEEATMLSMELVRKQKWASDIAFRWIATQEYPQSLCGWLTICHLLRTGNKLMPRSEQELRDHATAIPHDSPLPLIKAVLNTIHTLDEVTEPTPPTQTT